MSDRKGIGGHQSAKMKSDTWLTPPEIIKALGIFDLDPCCPENMPWPTANIMLTKQNDTNSINKIINFKVNKMLVRSQHEETHTPQHTTGEEPGTPLAHHCRTEADRTEPHPPAGAEDGRNHFGGRRAGLRGRGSPRADPTPCLYSTRYGSYV